MKVDQGEDPPHGLDCPNTAPPSFSNEVILLLFSPPLQETNKCVTNWKLVKLTDMKNVHLFKKTHQQVVSHTKMSFRTIKIVRLLFLKYKDRQALQRRSC